MNLPSKKELTDICLLDPAVREAYEKLQKIVLDSIIAVGATVLGGHRVQLTVPLTDNEQADQKAAEMVCSWINRHPDYIAEVAYGSKDVRILVRMP